MYNSPFPFTIRGCSSPTVATTCDSIPKYLQLYTTNRCVHEEGGSQTRGASGKSSELRPLQWTGTHKERYRWVPETWTSIPVAQGPQLPIAYSESLARRRKARFQYRPALLTLLAMLAVTKLVPKSALSLHPELYCWIGINGLAELEVAYMRGEKGEKREHSTQENFRSGIAQVSVS